MILFCTLQLAIEYPGVAALYKSRSIVLLQLHRTCTSALSSCVAYDLVYCTETASVDRQVADQMDNELHSNCSSKIAVVV